MILFPAIDLKDGQCVRLKLGEMAEATVFNDDPAAQARAFEDQGFQYLHVVDLNGAFAGKPVNAPAVEAILARRRPCRCSSAAASATCDTIEMWLAKGVRRVILGTVAVRDPDLVRDACRSVPRPRGGRHRCARAARSRSRAGPRPASSTPSNSRALRGRRRCRHHLHRHRSRRCSQGPQPAGHRRRSRAAIVHSRDRLGRPRRSSTISRRCCGRSIAMLEGAITGRALYDGRLDARAALALIAGAASRAP